VHALLREEITVPIEQIATMITVLPDDQWAAQLERLTRDQLQAGLFQALPTPWLAGVGNLVLDRIAAGRHERGTAHLADLAAYAVPPDCLNHPLAHQPPDYDAAPWRRRLFDTLTFRRAMYQELP
jgi:hypothetical protein